MESIEKDADKTALAGFNIDTAEVLKNINVAANLPYLKNIYLKEADNAFDAGDIPRSVFYQTEALCMHYRCKYLGEKAFDPYDLNERVDVEKLSFPDNPFLQYSLEKINDNNAKISSQQNSRETLETDPIRGYTNIKSFCRLLPDEWTVLHLSKKFNSRLSVSQSHEILTAGSSIYLTVLKNVRYDIYPYPICFSIDLCKHDFDFFTTFYSFDDKLREIISANKDDKVAYHFSLVNFDHKIKDAVDKLRAALGPWKCFFSGRAAGSDSVRERKLIDKVENFAKSNRLDAKQTVILFSLVREKDLLTKEDIMAGSLEVANNNTDLANVIEHFLQTVPEATTPMNCSPCILIIDEQLDSFFWEMINDRQEFCRISSLSLLKVLYNEYADQITDGYVKIGVDRGALILNPDKTLNDMDRRLSAFIEFWKPAIQCDIDRNMPTSATVTKYLTEYDVFIYCGHGSGLQFFSGNRITNIKSKSVVFLMGCESTQLKSEGLHSEMVGSHLYYFATKCPALIGTILVMFDRKCDLITTEIFSSWIPTANGNNRWKTIDQIAWAVDGKIVSKSKRKEVGESSFEPRLSTILRNIRLKVKSYHEKVSVVYRGLPVWNLNAKS